VKLCIGNLKFGETEFGEIKRNTLNWSNFCILLRRAGLSASAGLSCLSYYPRDAMLARVIGIATHLVCPFVTRRYCVKMKKASVIVSSPSCSPMILVFWRQISSPKSKGFSPNGGLKQGWGKKTQRFLALSVSISKTVADRAKVTINY